MTKSKRFGCLLVCMVLVLTLFAPSVQAAHVDYSQEDLLHVIEGVINWEKKAMGIATTSPLFDGMFLEGAGDGGAEWFAFSLGRLGYADDYGAYLAAMRGVVQERYQQEEKLSAKKATEWHRIALAILSVGGDPTVFGKDEADGEINLIADGTFNRGHVQPLGTQGVNGWIFGLITMDALRYGLPPDAHDTRDDMIVEILKMQAADGAFSLEAGGAMPDLTGMALQALAPYYNSEQSYTFDSKATEQTESKTVRQAVDQALEYISSVQLEDGDFSSFGAPNAETCAQVVVALCSLGIDIYNDARFIKNGNTVLDGLMKYRNSDGGFVHALDEGEGQEGGKIVSSSMASEQALYALAAVCRYNGNMRMLYDLRPEQDAYTKEQIAQVNQQIDDLSDTALEEEAVLQVFDEYLSIPPEERCYVFSYHKLADAMQELGMENTSEHLSEQMDCASGGLAGITDVFSQEGVVMEQLFNQADEQAYEALPEELTTQYYTPVVTLIEKIEGADNRQEHLDTLEALEQKKEQIETMQAEIESINEEIASTLVPLEKLTAKDKEALDSVLMRVEKLHPDDQQKVLHYEKLGAAQQQIERASRTPVVVTALLAVGAAVVAFIIWRRKKQTK